MPFQLCDFITEQSQPSGEVALASVSPTKTIPVIVITAQTCYSRPYPD